VQKQCPRAAEIGGAAVRRARPGLLARRDDAARPDRGSHTSTPRTLRMALARLTHWA
jgi:hypothetical protein